MIPHINVSARKTPVWDKVRPYRIRGKVSKSGGDAPSVDVITLDGSAAIIHMLKPINVKIFQEHVTQVLLPYFKAQVRIVTRTDIIWDEHLEASLTSRAREKRGKGV